MQHPHTLRLTHTRIFPRLPRWTVDWAQKHTFHDHCGERAGLEQLPVVTGTKWQTWDLERVIACL